MGKACVFHIRHIRRFSKVRSFEQRPEWSGRWTCARWGKSTPGRENSRDGNMFDGQVAGASCIWLGFRKNSISPSFFMTLQEGSRLMPLSSSSTVWESSFFLPHSSRGDKVVVAPNFANTSKTPTLKTSHHLEATCSAKSNFLSYRIRIEQWGSVLRVQSNCTVLDRTQRACSV